MIKPRTETSIVDVMQDKAIKEGALETQAREMKKIVVSSRKKGSHVCGSCIDPKDRRNGEVVHYSALQIAVHQVYERLKKEELPTKEVGSYTDLVIKLILDWDNVAKALEEMKLISPNELYSSTVKLKGKCRITAPWVNLAIREFYLEDFVRIFKQRRKGKEIPKEIGDFELRQQVSSVTSSIIDALDVMGLILSRKDKVGQKGTRASYLKDSLSKYSFDQLSFLCFEGGKIFRDKKRGKFDLADQLGVVLDVYDKETATRTIEIKPGKQEASSQFVEIKPDGTVVIEVKYR